MTNTEFSIATAIANAADKLRPMFWVPLCTELANVRGIETIDEAERLLGNYIELDRVPTMCAATYRDGFAIMCDRADGHHGDHTDYTFDAPSTVSWRVLKFAR